MRNTRLTGCAMLIFCIMLLSVHTPTTLADGPRTEDLVVDYRYEDLGQAYAALHVGEIDLLGHELTSTLFTVAAQNPEIVMGKVACTDMFQFDLNNDETIPSYPGIVSPTRYRGFRQALAQLTDKDGIVDFVCGGFANRIDQPIAAPHKSWANASYWYPYYPYEYHPAAAATTLDETGFTQGSTPNPYYDPAFPASAQYIRTYPPDHPTKAGEDLDSIEVVVRSDDYWALFAGRSLYEKMRKHGVPVRAVENDYRSIYYKVRDQHDYHVYTGSWSVPRFPPTYLYPLYHSNFAFPLGANYVTGAGTYPYLDQLLVDAANAATWGDASSKCRIALGYFTEECVTIPVWSTVSYYAWRNDLLGVVNMEGVGPENAFTFMNAYKSDATEIRFGLVTYPNSLNIIYASWDEDYQCLDRMNLFGGVEVPPYNPSVDQAGFVKEWDVGTWDDDGTTKTKVSRTFRNDGYFVKPVSGDQKSNVNASHFFFSAWYMYHIIDSWWWAEYAGVHHIDIVGSHEVDIYFDSLSYWNMYSAAGPIVPMDTWAQQSELVGETTESFVEGITVVTPGIVDLSEDPVWIEEVRVNGVPLTRFSDYNIVEGKLEIFQQLAYRAGVEVDYWYVVHYGSYGLTPGGLPWQTILEGAGMFYAVQLSYNGRWGGYLTLKRNPFYYMETPLLGDVDFIRKANGCYKIDIFDLAIAGGAYGSQGTGVPSPNWVPGADLAPPGGVIDIYDMATIGSQWDMEWDCPP